MRGRGGEGDDNPCADTISYPQLKFDARKKSDLHGSAPDKHKFALLLIDVVNDFDELQLRLHPAASSRPETGESSSSNLNRVRPPA
jgi:hypothetical protein